MTPQEIAQACAEAMWNDDRASQRLGMTIEHVGPGEATLGMTITKSMTNGHGTCHGGYIFTLADSAFAFACNSYNQRAVAQHCSVTFIAPAYRGNRLTATAREVSRRGRGGIYDITVTNQDGEQVAEFRGHSRTVKGTHLPE
jgi:acyl-CoA thioesterase